MMSRGGFGQGDAMLDDEALARQFLGACALDEPSPEVLSLISNVQDLFPDLSDQYVMACLKHYKNSTESVINAILEGSVPSDILDEDSKVEQLPVRQPTPPPGKLYKKEDALSDSSFLVPAKELKERILQLHDAHKDPKKINGKGEYLEESLLPRYRTDNEYDDEYDDSYDEVCIGLTEPDAQPLNLKKARRFGNEEDEQEEEEEENGEDEPGKRPFEQFVEDPAVVRARMQQRRDDKYGKPQQQQGSKDVKGKAKGQGQSSEVLLNRRRKDEAGSHNRKKQSDFKRKQF